jgi:hypothetical protein
MRRRAFGIEPPGSLLSASDVALFSLGVLLDESTGNVYDVTNQQVRNALQENGIGKEFRNDFKNLTITS